MIMRKIFLFLAALVCCMTSAMAQVTWDFAAPVSSGQTLYFDITDDVNLYCEVVKGLAHPEGELVIDAQVVSNMDGKTYTVRGIADEAFFWAGSLTKVTFPTAATFTYIGKSNMFSHAIRDGGLTGELVIPDNVTFIGGTAFLDDEITSLKLGSGVTELYNSVFKNTKLSHVVLPNTVTTLWSDAFANNANLTYIEFGNAVELFYTSCINYCDKLDTIVINTSTPPTVQGSFPDNLTSNAFLFVPSGAVDTYKAHERWGAFKHIFAIGTDVTLKKLTFNTHTDYAINDNCAVYADDESVKNGGSIKLVSGETTHLRFEPQKYWALQQVLLDGADITSQVKENKLDVTITDDATLDVRWYQPVPAYDFAEVVESGQTLYFQITDAVNHKAKIVNQSGGRGYTGRQEHAYIEQAGDGSWIYSTALQPKGDLVIPTSIKHGGQTYTVTAIDTLTFCKCSEITSLIIPEGITAIGAAAFMGCGKINGKMILPSSCSVLSEWAFRDCSLSEIDLGGATSLEEYVLFGNKNIKNIVTGPAVKQLKPYSLSNLYNLESVEIGENVEFVSSYSFGGDNQLKTVKILAATPPAVKWAPESSESSNWYSYNPSSSGLNAKLIVPWSPDHSVQEAYKKAKCWGLFASIEESEYVAPSYTDGVLSGKFTINSSNDQVQFSQGNLQHVGSTWQFAESQMEYFGIHQSDDQRDLFGWGTGEAPNTISTDAGDYPAFKEWGDNAIVNGGNKEKLWRTLTKDEWDYIVNDRPTGVTVNGVDNARYTLATVATSGVNVVGLLIFPDGFTGAETAGVTWGTINAKPDLAYDTKCTVDGWDALEAAGVVFLPAAGFRDGTTVEDVGSHCIYWTATAHETDPANAYLFYVTPDGIGFIVPDVRYEAMSVRLVRPVEKGPGTGMENHKSQITNHKYLKDGQLIIERNGVEYNVTGQMSK